MDGRTSSAWASFLLSFTPVPPDACANCMSGLEKIIEEKLGRWRQQGEAAEYYALRNRGPYKPTVSHELNRFGGQMGPYVDALLDLQTVEYINASPIDNLGEEAPAFIATMCPKRSTFEHFWMMVWETGARVIVNLTHERDKVGSAPADKRERYWPPFDEAMERESRGWAVQVRTLGHESCESVAGLLRYAVELRGSASGGPPPSRGERTRVVVLYWYSRWRVTLPAAAARAARSALPLAHRHRNRSPRVADVKCPCAASMEDGPTRTHAAHDWLQSRHEARCHRPSHWVPADLGSTFPPPRRLAPAPSMPTRRMCCTWRCTCSSCSRAVTPQLARPPLPRHLREASPGTGR